MDEYFIFVVFNSTFMNGVLFMNSPVMGAVASSIYDQIATAATAHDFLPSIAH